MSFASCKSIRLFDIPPSYLYECKPDPKEIMGDLVNWWDRHKEFIKHGMHATNKQRLVEFLTTLQEVQKFVNLLVTDRDKLRDLINAVSLANEIYCKRTEKNDLVIEDLET